MQYATAIALMPLLASMPGPLTLGLPSIGVDGCSRALSMLGVPYRVLFGYDTARHVEIPLLRFHGTLNNIHLGPAHGDILNVPIHTLYGNERALLPHVTCPTHSCRKQESPHEDIFCVDFDCGTVDIWRGADHARVRWHVVSAIQ